MIRIEIKSSKNPKRFKKKVEQIIKATAELQKKYPHVGNMEIIVRL